MDKRGGAHWYKWAHDSGRAHRPASAKRGFLMDGSAAAEKPALNPAPPGSPNCNVVRLKTEADAQGELHV